MSAPSSTSAGPRDCFLSILLAVLMLFAGGVCAEPAHAEPPPPPVHSAGMPLLQNFKPETYSGYPQNWAVVQDHRGVIYVANGEDGVLEFDGTLWRHIAVPNQGMVRSLAVDAQGRVYVGCVGEFGYLRVGRDSYKNRHFGF